MEEEELKKAKKDTNSNPTIENPKFRGLPSTTKDTNSNKKCQRCGMCCLSVPKWNELSDIERAMLRKYDKNAEIILKDVGIMGCPKLSFKGNKAICLIYPKRCNFCKALKFGSKECKYARGLI